MFLFVILLSLNSNAQNLIQQDFKDYTEIVQVESFYSYSEAEKCQISKWVHENNALFVRQMYMNGFTVHPERLQRTSEDVHTYCDVKVKPARKALHRCGRYENCLDEAEILRIISER